MCKEAYLVMDIGTGNSRVVLMSVEGELIGIRSFANPYHRDYAYEDALYSYLIQDMASRHLHLRAPGNLLYFWIRKGKRSMDFLI